MMVEVAKTQDNEVGDGTTSAVVVTGELLGKAEELIEKNVHPTIIIDGYRKAAAKALETLDKIAITVDSTDKDFLKKVAKTSMASKLVAEHRDSLAEIAASAVIHVAQEIDGKYTADLDDILVEKKAGESLADTALIEGVVLDKEIVHPGMPKRVENAKLALVDSAFEVEKTEFEAKMYVESPEQMEAFLKEEENLLKDMVDKLVAKGVTVLMCQKGIDDLAQHFLARQQIVALRRVKKSDLEKLAKATGGKVVTNLDDLTDDDLGNAALIEERKIADDKMTFVEGCTNPRAIAILIRGGTDRLIDEAERSLHDALCVVRNVIEEPKIVAGGGSSEVEIAKILKDYADTLPGREQLAVQRFAEAFESIPIALSENAGLDPIDILSDLHSRHEKGEVWAGIDVNEGKVTDMKKLEVYDPLVVKKQIVKSGTEAATMILKIDDVIASGKMKAPPTPPGGPGGMGGPGMSPYGGMY
jgi:thermosome